VCFVALAVLSFSVFTPSQTDSTRASSCKQFAESFYSWYVPFTQKNFQRPAFEIALEKRPTAFSPELLLALRADAQAQRGAKGEIVGIDFDPFVGSQDPARHYDARKATLRGEVCLVEVWRDLPSDNSAKSDEPDVVAEISNQTGQWHFDNFQYPSLKADLKQVLISLQDERRKHR
jgi:hypothetical protein